MNDQQRKDLTGAPNLSALAALVAAEQTAPPEQRLEPLKFPWPEIRDFISVLISQMLAQQNMMVGENMLKNGMQGVSEEELEKVRATYRHLEQTTQNLNKIIEHRLREQQTGIILPR